MDSILARWSLKGKTALVTGATKGIGKAIAEELAQLGASVYVCARSEDDLQQRLREWADAGLPIVGCVCDVSSYPSCEQLMAQVSHHFHGKLHILVLNAGTGRIAPIMEMPPEEMLLMMRTNFDSGVHLSRLAHPLLKASGAGSIVFNSSIAGSLIALPDMSIYQCTKAAVNQLTRSLAFEWAKDGIRVNAVAPGYTLTEAIATLVNDEMKESVKTRIPLRRFGDVHEIATAVAFLCMPCASYVTGSIVTVDGGMTCHNIHVACPSIEAS